MTEEVFETPCGHIHYWVNDIRTDRQSLVFLPGLTAVTGSLTSRWRTFSIHTMCWFGTHRDTPHPGLLPLISI